MSPPSRNVYCHPRVLLALLAAVVLTIAGTCVIERHLSDRDQLAADLATYRAQWNRLGIHDYSYRLVMGCSSCSSTRGRFSVVVASDTVSTVTRDTTVAGDTTPIGSIPTVGYLFQTIQNALDIPDWGVGARFNETMGYPESIWVDYDTRAAGSDYTYGVDSVAVRQ